jgi:hypothetical protein
MEPGRDPARDHREHHAAWESPDTLSIAADVKYVKLNDLILTPL